MVAEGGIDSDELGRSTWKFLHTLAATYPASPSEEERTRMKRFMEDFAHVYPCAPCASSFREILHEHPVQTKTGPQFAQWMCDVHNQVNLHTGKQLFDCAKVGDIWGVCESCERHKDELTLFKSAFKVMGLSKQQRSKGSVRN